MIKKSFFKAPQLRDKKNFDFWREKWSGIYIAENMYSVSAYLADIQWFGRALTILEMQEITTCKSFSEGKHFSFLHNQS